MTNSRHLVDPELLGLLDLWPTLIVDATTLPLLRDPSRIPVPPIANPERVERTMMVAPGRDGAPDVPLICYRPAGRAGEALPCIYHIHGGGYIAGATGGLEPLHRELVDTLGCALVTVDYRLAPETPFPGPLEDCYTGLAWLMAHAGEVGIHPSRIGVKGESAGGGLAAALALLVRDRGEYALAFQHLAYPMLDDRTCVGEPNPLTGDYIWTPASNAFGWRCYLGAEPGGTEISPYAAPARAADLAGLPPAFIATGSLDLFVEEDIAYATRLLRAGVATELHVYPGGVHAFDIHPTARIARQMRRDSTDWLRRQLFPMEQP